MNGSVAYMVPAARQDKPGALRGVARAVASPDRSETRGFASKLTEATVSWRKAGTGREKARNRRDDVRKAWWLGTPPEYQFAAV